MGLASNIEWTDATWNPWQGCTKVSEACADCYMFRDLRRYGRDPTVVVRSKPPTFRLPLKRRKSGEYAIPAGRKVFTCSWSDWFHERSDAWRPEAWDMVRARPDLIFQIVTKRPERIADCLPADWGGGWPNVWLIVTAENQQRLEERIGHLLSVPAAVRGLSIEPLLGPMKLHLLRNESGNPAHCVCGHGHGFTRCPNTGGIAKWCHVDGCTCTDFQRRPRSWHGIDWVIVGGESGHHARPMHPDWIRSLRDQCEAAGVPFFFKQWGEWYPIDEQQLMGDDTVARLIDCGDFDPMCFGPVYGQQEFVHLGKKLAGRLLDGREWSEFHSLGEPVHA